MLEAWIAGQRQLTNCIGVAEGMKLLRDHGDIPFPSIATPARPSESLPSRLKPTPFEI